MRADNNHVAKMGIFSSNVFKDIHLNSDGGDTKRHFKY